MTKEKIIENCKEYLLSLDNKINKTRYLNELVKTLSKGNLHITSIIDEVITNEDVILPQDNYIEVSTYIFIIKTLNEPELLKSIDKLKNIQEELINLGGELNKLLFSYDSGRDSKYYFDFEKMSEEIKVETDKALKIIYPNAGEERETLNPNELFNEATTLLSETYFGKSKLLSEVEEKFKKLRDDYLNNGKNPNNTKELTTIGKLLCKQFNFEEITIEIFPSTQVNAYTMPLFILNDLGEEDFTLVKDKFGIKYKNKKNKRLFVVFYSGFIKQFNETEIVSCLLHEIGHNFFLNKENITNYKKQAYSKICLKLLSLFIYYISISNYSTAFKVLNVILGLSKEYDDPYKYYKTQMDQITKDDKTFKKNDNKKNLISKVLNKLLMFTTNIFSLILSPLLLISNYQYFTSNKSAKNAYVNETFADNFAASFGYGMARVSYKFINNGKPENLKIPIYGLITSLLEINNSLVVYFADEHPDEYTRIVNTRAKLQYELDHNKKYLSPSQIKSIEDELKDIDILIKGLSKNYKMIYKLFNRIGLWKKKIAMNDNNVTDSDIYDFDKTILKDFIEESYYLDLDEGSIL